MKFRIAITLALLATMAGTSRAAWDWFGGRLSLGAGYGVGFPEDGPDGLAYDETYDDAKVWSGNLKYFVNDTISVVASFMDVMHREENTDAALRFQPIVGSIRANIFQGLPISPYITAGAGVSINRHEQPGFSRNEWTKPAYQAGVGLEFFITPNASLGAEGLYHHLRAPGDNDPFSLVTLQGTVNFYFGDDPRTERLKARADEAERRAEENATMAAQAQQSSVAAQQQTAIAAEQERMSAEAASQAQLDAAEAARQAAEAEAARRGAEARAGDLESRTAQAEAELQEMRQLVEAKELKAATFASGSANLLPDSDEQIKRVAEIAKKYPDLRLRVEGHTDNAGPEAKNQTLSQARADAVKRRLAQEGVSESKISAEGFGESRPIASNDTAEGKRQNRRVEFHWAKP